MNLYTYIPEKHCLRQKPTMAEPLEHPSEYEPGNQLYKFWYEEWLLFNEHIVSLQEYPCAPGTVWEEGKEYVEGRDFTLESKTHKRHCPCHLNSSIKHIKSCCDNGVVRTGMFIAIPVQKYRNDAEIEQIWKDADRELKEALLGEEINEMPGYTTTEAHIFTLQDMLECWEAAIGDVNGTEKEKYFKQFE